MPLLFAVTEFNTTGVLLGTLGILLLCSALFGRVVERFGVPVVFLFLVLGMLAGSEGVGRLPFEDYQLAFRVGTAALILILLDGGLNTSLRSIRASVAPAVVLATVGVAITAGAVAVFARWLGMTWGEALLIGTVVSSTDAAAVFATLRGGGLNLPRRVGSTIELESGINDPMAVILTIAVTALLLGQAPNPSRLAVVVPVQLAVGFLVGLACGYAARFALRRVRLGTVGLYPVLTLGVGMLTFGAATLLQGSGFLAVFVTAVVLGNGPLAYRGGLLRIHDALGWLSQVAMFLMLGLLVFPSQLVPVAADGFLVALFLSFVARPLAVALCLAPFRYPWREMLYISWVGLRGAVPIVLATIPVISGVPDATTVFNIVFFVVVMNALLPGVTIGFVTQRLGLREAQSPTPPAVLEINSTRELDGELRSFHISKPLAVCDASLSEIPFPPDAAAVLVIRDEKLLAARGSTVLRPGDHVYVFCREADRAFIELLFGRPQE